MLLCLGTHAQARYTVVCVDLWICKEMLLSFACLESYCSLFTEECVAKLVHGVCYST